MSFVSIVGFKDFISIMSDGRVSILINGTYRIVNENFPKFRILNDTSFIAFTGVKELIEEIIDKSGILTTDIINWKGFSIFLKNILQEEKYVNMKLNFAFGGKLAENNMGFYTISTRDHILKFIDCNDTKNYNYAFLFSNNYEDYEFIDKKYKECINIAEGDTTIRKVKSSQELLNAVVADKDVTVNNNIFYYLIQQIL